MNEINTHGLICDFGKHKGLPYTRLPVSYLKWLVNTPGHRAQEIARAELVRLTQERAGLCNSVDRLMAANERLRGLLREARYYAATDKYGPDESLLRRIDAAMGEKP